MSSMYILRDDGQLVEMNEHSYDSEDLLQRLLAQYPHLLAGDLMGYDIPRRWLLVAREIGVSPDDTGVTRWSLDHLFLDQDGIPTLVEVKRSTDTRIRREVVGQLLDYAANAVKYWPVEVIRATLESRCLKEGIDPTQTLANLIVDQDIEEFWQQVKTNLQAGKIRMVFVADVIPRELQNVVEFLNSQMDPATVLAVEIRQYVGQDLKTLVPRVLGMTAEAMGKKPLTSGAAKQWNEDGFLEALEQRCGLQDANAARAIINWALDQQLQIWWGRGRKDGSFFPMLTRGGISYVTFALWTYGRVEIQFERMKVRPPFDNEEMREAFRRRLNEIPGIQVPSESLGHRPAFPLALLHDAKHLAQFLGAIDFALAQVRGTANE